MLVKNIINVCKFRLRNIAAVKDEEAVINAVYLGVSDLYNRFNLKIKSGRIDIEQFSYTYEIKDPKAQMLLGVYSDEGVDLNTSDVFDSRRWQYKQINYNSFIINPKEYNRDYVYVVYKASPNDIRSIEDTVELPDAMIEALMLYVCWLFNSTVSSFSSSNNRGGATEADYMYKKYLEECTNLDNMGYKICINTESVSLMLKGFV